MRPFLLLPLVLSACAASAGVQAPATVEYFRRPGSTAPFSSAVRVGDTIYLSGSVGIRPDGSTPEGIEAQARQAMENMRANLTIAGRTFDDIVKCTVMLESMSDWPAFNRVYVTYFKPDRLPARSAFGVDGIALGSLVEIECIAHAPAAGAPR